MCLNSAVSYWMSISNNIVHFGQHHAKYVSTLRFYCNKFALNQDYAVGSSYTVKKVREFPVPSRDVTTKLSLGGNNDVITELLLPSGSLVSDIPAGDGKLVNHFLRCIFFQSFHRTVLHRGVQALFCSTDITGSTVT
jgi:hypothetical protein